MTQEQKSDLISYIIDEWGLLYNTEKRYSQFLFDIYIFLRSSENINASVIRYRTTKFINLKNNNWKTEDVKKFMPKIWDMICESTNSVK